MCRFLKSYRTVFSQEKRNAVYIALAGVYNCVECKEIHQLKYEEEKEHGKIKE